MKKERVAGEDSHALSDSRHGPPRAPLAFRVGIVGHRPNRLGDADLVQLAEVLGTIQGIVKDEVFAMREREPSLFDSSQPICRAISPLAEGTDRIFAEQAMQLGFELCCVMPFHQAEFERDFAPGVALEENSLARFRELVGQAETRFELDGTRSDEAGAYSAAGQTVLNQCDLLVLVWDGKRQNKRGGTEETLDEARGRGVPIIWVDAHAPHHWQILDGANPLQAEGNSDRLAPGGAHDIGGLRDLVRAALELPEPARRTQLTSHELKAEALDVPSEGLQVFYAERQPRWTLAVVWKAFRDVVGDGTFPSVSFSIPEFEGDVKDEWPEDRSSKPGEIVDRLRPFYAWPDKLAVVCSNRYRSAYIVAFLLAAFAVGMALVPFGLGLEAHRIPETICIVLELSAIIVILCLVIVGRHSHWHKRWIDYRLAAELVRHLRLVAPVGGGRPFPQIPAHWAIYGQPGSTWMAWYVRAVERALGLPTVVVNNSYLDAALSHLGELVKGQAEFHEVSQNRSHQIEGRLHWLGVALLYVTLAACLLHVLPDFFDSVHYWHWVAPLLTFCCGFFPALGAAMAGIVNQGEFRRVSNRSESMHEQLVGLSKEIESLRSRIGASSEPAAEQFSVRVRDLANDVARLLLNEVLDWRVVFLDQPIVPPT